MKIKVEKTLLKSLLTLATLIEARDAYTGGHTWRVSEYSKLLAEDLGMNKEEAFAVQIGALVHDLGKVGIPDAILNKKGPLDEKEYNQMKNHPLIGLKAIQDHPLKEIVVASIEDHHKRPDGKGYPEAQEEKPLSTVARIVSVADAFDAMTSTRPYREGMPSDKALTIVTENIGTQFDKDIAERLIALHKKGKLNGILAHAYNGVEMLTCPVCGPIMVPSSHSSDGGPIMCPGCTGMFTLHSKGDSFSLEYKGFQGNFYVPGADEYSIQAVLDDFQPEVSFG